MEWSKYCLSDLTIQEYDKWYSMMSIEKQERVMRFRFLDDRKRTVIGEMLARTMISSKMKCSPESIRFAQYTFGKPYVANLPVEFNISHSGDVVVCAIHDKPIGIDVEKIQQISKSLVRTVCTEKEYSYVVGDEINNDTYSPNQLERFFKVWTYKEAYLKMIGRGIEGLEQADYTEDKCYRFEECFAGYCLTIVTQKDGNC